jgi:hypothetical protein
MLDGTNLADAYTTITSSLAQDIHFAQPVQEKAKEPPQKPQLFYNSKQFDQPQQVQQQHIEEKPIQKVRIQHSPQIQQNFADNVNESQQNSRQVYQSRAPQVIRQPQILEQELPESQYSSYFDNIVTKRKDILKIIVFSTSIVFAISLHSVIQFWLQEVSISNEFGFKQELGIRVLYPVSVLLLIWLFKAFLTR